jgi:hypothetical protein
MNPTITIDPKLPVPIYRQIADAMRHLLVSGRLQPGDAVPTVRDLAVDLGESCGLPSEEKRGNDRHVKRCSPVNIDGRRKAKMAQNDQTIAQRDENCNGQEYSGGAPVSPPEEEPGYETRKDIANSLDPHKRKGGGVVDRNAEGS